MRIQILSDIHLDCEAFDIPEDPTVDVVVLAGDIACGTEGLDWAKSRFSSPVIYVPGNHEFYESVRPPLIQKLKRKAHDLGIHLLDCNSIRLGEAEFFGATLWTDFNFYNTPELDMAYAQRNVIDFHIIEEDREELFSPAHAARVFEQSVTWLDCALEKSSAAKKIVITHHAPSAKSVVSRFAGSPLNPAFSSNLDALIERHSIDLWIHGHMHTVLDYELHKTRIICNPRGYQPYESHNGFEPYKVVNI